MSWTEEELAALPQTQAIFEQQPMVVNDHEWLQEGYMMRDNCHPATINCVNAGIPIPQQKLLVKDQKGYHLVDEITRK